MKKLMGALVTAALLGPWGGPAAWAQDAMLTVVQDESSMEQLIARFLRANHNLTVNEKDPTGNDLWLELPMNGDPVPPYKILVDTQVLNRDGTTKLVIERGVLVELHTGVKVPDARRVALLNLINAKNQQKVFCSAYVDTGGEIIFGWVLNVMSSGLATEYVYDAIAREDKLWRGAYPEVAEALK